MTPISALEISRLSKSTKAELINKIHAIRLKLELALEDHRGAPMNHLSTRSTRISRMLSAVELIDEISLALISEEEREALRCAVSGAKLDR